MDINWQLKSGNFLVQIWGIIWLSNNQYLESICLIMSHCLSFVKTFKNPFSGRIRISSLFVAPNSDDLFLPFHFISFYFMLQATEEIETKACKESVSWKCRNLFYFLCTERSFTNDFTQIWTFLTPLCHSKMAISLNLVSWK